MEERNLIFSTRFRFRMSGDHVKIGPPPDVQDTRAAARVNHGGFPHRSSQIHEADRLHGRCQPGWRGQLHHDGGRRGRSHHEQAIGQQAKACTRDARRKREEIGFRRPANLLGATRTVRIAQPANQTSPPAEEWHSAPSTLRLVTAWPLVGLRDNRRGAI